MNTYLVFLGEYPFDVLLGTLTALNEEEALASALEEFGGHPVVQLKEGTSQ